MNQLLLMVVLLKNCGSQILSFSVRHQKSATKLSDLMICYEYHQMVKYFYELVKSWRAIRTRKWVIYPGFEITKNWTLHWPILSSTIYDWNGVRYEFSTVSIWLSTLSDTFRKMVRSLQNEHFLDQWENQFKNHLAIQHLI